MIPNSIPATASLPTVVRRAAGERGAGLVEYALLVALIALVCLSSLQLFGVTNGGSVNRSASSVADSMDT